MVTQEMLGTCEGNQVFFQILSILKLLLVKTNALNKSNYFIHSTHAEIILDYHQQKNNTRMRLYDLKIRILLSYTVFTLFRKLDTKQGTGSSYLHSGTQSCVEADAVGVVH